MPIWDYIRYLQSPEKHSPELVRLLRYEIRIKAYPIDIW